jgi:hypothetical protein
LDLDNPSILDGHPAFKVAAVFGVENMAFSETTIFASEVVIFNNAAVQRRARAQRGTVRWNRWLGWLAKGYSALIISGSALLPT